MTPKPKAPAWLTTAFAEGVVELMPPRPAPAYRGAHGRCWLAQFDERRRACAGPFQRFHFVNRQRVRNALGAQLPDLWGTDDRVPVEDPFTRMEILLFAEWDSRNGGVGCETHHSRLDSHATPPLTVPRSALPAHVEEWAEDWGTEALLAERFPEAVAT